MKQLLKPVLALAFAPALAASLAAQEDIIALNDEFEDASVAARWQGELAGPELDVGTSRLGWLALEGRSKAADGLEKPLLFKEIRGDFVITTRVAVSDGASGGIVARGGKTTVAVALVSSARGGSAFEIRAGGKARRQPVEAVGGVAELQVARVGDALMLLGRGRGGAWRALARLGRSDLPDTLSVGLAASGEAFFDYARFRRPNAPDTIAPERLADESAVADEALLGFLGDRANSPAQDDPRTWRWNVDEPSPVEGVSHGEIWSESMQRVVGYDIFLPPSYERERERRFPAMYWLHGAWGDGRMDGGLAEMARQLMLDGEIEEFIIVSPNAGQFSTYRDWPDANVKAETWIIKELIPEIDRRYRTRAERGSRAASGYSMGGGGATRLGFKHPEMFCSIASFSGALGWNASRGASPWSEPEEGPDDAYHWARAHRDLLKGRTSLMFTVGGAESLYDRHPPFMALLRELELDFSYFVHAKLGHDLGKTKELSGEDMLRMVDAAFRGGEGPEAGNSE